jgi:chromosome segregation ATPase
MEMSIRQRENYDAAKTGEISRLKNEIQQLREEKVRSFGNISEAEDKIARLKDQTLSLKAELDAEREHSRGLDTTLKLSDQAAENTTARLKKSESDLEQLKKENRRLAHDLEFAMSSLTDAENKLSEKKDEIATLNNKLNMAKAHLSLDTNKMLTLMDEKTLLVAEVQSLKKVQFR